MRRVWAPTQSFSPLLGGRTHAGCATGAGYSSVGSMGPGWYCTDNMYVDSNTRYDACAIHSGCPSGARFEAGRWTCNDDNPGGVGEVVAEEAPGDLAEASMEVYEVHADTFPDVTTGLDVAGPYLEEPHEDEADSPRPATLGWENATSLQAAVSDTWGGSFCTSHRTGFFCDGTTRVRCCRKTWGFVKCGTTVRSSSCGWHGGGYPSGGGGGSWHIHPGWHQSSFCSVHHTGWFCARHKKVHCCNDYGHFVDCTTYSRSSWRC